MASRVDLPQPEGPAMATYSPLRISRWTPERAWVSSSSVKKTFLTASSWMRAGRSSVMAAPEKALRKEIWLLEADAVDGVPGRHVGQNDLVARRQAFEHLDAVGRAAAVEDGDPGGGVAVDAELEKAGASLGLARGRPGDGEGVLDVLDLDGAVDREVGAGAARQLAFEGHVHQHGAFGDRGVDAHHLAGHLAVAGVDQGGQAEGHVARLGLGHPQLG